MSWILIGMIQKSSFNLFKKSANTAFLLPSHDSRLSVAISSPPRSLPSRIMPCQMISSQKAKRKKKTYFPKQPSGRTALNVSIHLHPISHSGLHSSHYVAADRSHMQELEYSDRPNVLAAAEFSAWLIPFLHPTSSPPPRSFRLIPPLAAVICYSYFLRSGKRSFRLFLESKWNRSHNVGIFKLLFSCLLVPTGKETELSRVKWNNEREWWHFSFSVLSQIHFYNI